MTEVERRVLEAVDISALLECLADLIAFRSEGGSETPAQEFMAQRMADLDMSVDRWEIDLARLRTHPAYSAEIDHDNALGVVGLLSRGAGRALVLNGHVDVVPAGEPGRWKPTFRSAPSK